MREITVTVDGIDLIVEYHFIGTYRAATLEDPPEWPELEIDSVKVNDSEIDIYELLSKKQMETLENSIFANED